MTMPDISITPSTKPLTTPDISLIVTTYNWPLALRSVLKALMHQTHQAFEIIIADDGSGETTREVISSFQKRSSIPIHHVWQPDEGFRVSRIRNLAIQAARAPYIVFMDGDCIPRPHFIENHLSQAEPGFFLVGHRVLLSKAFTIKVLSEDLPIFQWSSLRWGIQWCLRRCNRFTSFLPLPLPTRKLFPKRWAGAKGCNLGIWKKDLHTINAWEEEFTGWGYEDSDLVIRLINAGINRKEGRFAVPVIHLWHPANDRSNEKSNWNLLQHRIHNFTIKAQQGLHEHDKTALSEL